MNHSDHKQASAFANRLLQKFRSGFRSITHVFMITATLHFVSPETWATEEVPTDQKTVQLEISSGDATSKIEGHILVEAQDGGILLEERNGRIRQLTPAMIVSRTKTDVAFSRMSADELGADLLNQVPAGFEIFPTDHYVICSNSSEEYVEFCGKLLERVYREYFEFTKEQGLVVVEPKAPLPIIILQSEADFKEFAAKQHPETSFENTPGYYSIRENQTLLIDLTRDRSLRSSSAIRKRLAEQPLQVATMVHESVHQLAFNSGLQVRMADNPVWFSEGLALYFEPIVPRSSTLWTRPGIVNARHHTEFAKRTESGQPEIAFRNLLQTDQTFLDNNTVAIAYAESWALTSYLFRQHKDGMTKYLTNLSRRKPLVRITAEERIQEFEAAFEKSPDEIERAAVSYVRRLRIPK